MAASKRFYVDHGITVAMSYGRRTGSHQLAIGSDAGPFTDPDGFTWESTTS